MVAIIFLFCLITTTLTTNVCGYKIILFVASMSRSNMLYHSRVGELLAERGHQVTLYTPAYDPQVQPEKFVNKARLMQVPAADPAVFETLHRRQQEIIFQDYSLANRTVMSTFSNISKSLYDACEGKHMR